MPVFDKANFKPRPAKRNPGKAPGKYDAQIPQTVPLTQRAKPPVGTASESRWGLRQEAS
jgi:hypothetical protein